MADWFERYIKVNITAKLTMIADILANVYKQKPTAEKDPEYEECLSCQ